MSDEPTNKKQKMNSVRSSGPTEGLLSVAYLTSIDDNKKYAEKSIAELVVILNSAAFHGQKLEDQMTQTPLNQVEMKLFGRLEKIKGHAEQLKEIKEKEKKNAADTVAVRMVDVDYQIVDQRLSHDWDLHQFEERINELFLWHEDEHVRKIHCSVFPNDPVK
jgi:hypothetical protein